MGTKAKSSQPEGGALEPLAKVEGVAAVTHKPDARVLEGFPLLVYAPSQWGPGVRLEDCGHAVADIAEAFESDPDADAVAARFGTTAEHVMDAVRYASRASTVDTPEE